MGIESINNLWEEIDFVNDMFESFNMSLYSEGYLAPLFFGSALNNFGVLELLETFLEIAPCPGIIQASEHLVEPDEEQLTGFVFKIHANLDPFKTKQLDKGVRQMTDESVSQLFTQQPDNRKIIGTVGELQYEVIKFRPEHEYGAKCSFSALPFIKACWITTDDKKELEKFLSRKSAAIAYDKENNPVFFAESEWMLKLARENFPSITFHETSDFKIRKNKKS